MPIFLLIHLIFLGSFLWIVNFVFLIDFFASAVIMGLIMAENATLTPPPVVEAGLTVEVAESKEKIKRLIADAVDIYKDIRNQVDSCIGIQEGAVSDQNAEVLGVSLDPDAQDQEKNSVKGYLENIADGNSTILNRVKNGLKDLDQGEDPEGTANADQKLVDVDKFLSVIRYRNQLLEQASDAIQYVSMDELRTAQSNSQSAGYTEINSRLISDKAEELMNKNREFITDVVRNLDGSKTLDEKIRAIETAWEEFKQKLPK